MGGTQNCGGIGMDGMLLLITWVFISCCVKLLGIF